MAAGGGPFGDAPPGDNVSISLRAASLCAKLPDWSIPCASPLSCC